LTGDHLTGVKSHAQLEVDTVAVLDLLGNPLRLLLNTQGSQASTDRVILRRCWRAEHGHDSVAGELVHRAPKRCTTELAQLTSSAMISRSRSAPTAAAMSIE
jgi:hypothetical protein